MSNAKKEKYLSIRLNENEAAIMEAICDHTLIKMTTILKYIVTTSMTTSRGNNIVIKHKVEEVNGKELVIYSHYFHLQKGSIKVQPGDKVTTGQHIAGVGSSGVSTGYHLHFAISKSSVITSGFNYAYDPNDWVYIHYP